MGLKDMWISFVLIFIFSISLVTYAVWFAEDNSSAISLADNDDLSDMASAGRTSANSNVEVYNSSLEAFQTTPISGEGAETIESGGFFNLAPEGLSTFKNIMAVGYKEIFGGDSSFHFIISSIIGLVVVVLGMLIWKAVKGGNPE